MAISRTLATRIAVIVLIVALVFLFRSLPIGTWLVEIEGWVRAHPVIGALTYLFLAVLAIVAFTPGWIPMMLAGLVFGFMPGFPLALLAIVIGATGSMLAGRTLVRRWVEKRIAEHPRLMALDQALDEQAFTIIILTRLALILPFNLLNYAYGLTRVRAAGYALATTIGMLPAVALYVYLGTLARDIGQILEGNADTGIGLGWLLGLAVAALVAVAIVVQRTVRRTLDRHTAQEVLVDRNERA